MDGQTGSRGDDSATLLVRKASPDVVPLIAPIVSPSRLSPDTLDRLAKEGGVLVLADAAAPVSVPPIAAAVFDLDRPVRLARLVALGVATPLRRRGLGRRLFDGAAILLRAQGVERVAVSVPPGGTASAFLAALGFEAATATTREDLVYWL